MRMHRTSTVVLATALAAAVPVAGQALSSPAPAPLYRLRPDPRLCPSPACGGFWIARPSATTTRCADGARRPWCYVATVDLAALPARVRARAQPQLGRALVGGRLERDAGDGTPVLATLVVDGAWLPAAAGTAAAAVYLVVDTGVRCIRAPCFSFRANAAGGTRSLRLSEVDLAVPGAPPGAVARAHLLLGRGGVLVSGAVTTVRSPSWPDTGRRLDASQLWLPA
jgi:uncharacterized protein DUF6748